MLKQASALQKEDKMDKPNFLLIITDQQRADTLGLYGSEIGATPNIDLLGSTGVTFNRGYCNNPLCMPSRASILAGRYPSVTGVRTNGVIARSGQPLLPELLSKAGYQTGAFGKIHYHPSMGTGSLKPDEYWPEHPDTIASGEDLTKPYLGFQTVALACGHGDVSRGLQARELSEKFPDVYSKRGANSALLVPDPLLHHAQKINTYKTSIPEEHYPTTWVVNKTIDFIEKTQEPFFVWCGINDPHHPFKPPGHYWEMFKPEDMPLPIKRDGEMDDKPPHFRNFFDGKYKDMDTDGFLLGNKDYLTDERIRIIKAAYYGMVAMIDDNVARMLKVLEDKGLRQNTIVIFVSDHGEFMGDHGFVLKGPMHYENVLRVPFLWNWPGNFPEKHTVDGPVGLIDLFPTILDLANIPAPEGAQGKSLIEQLKGNSHRRHEEVYIENDVDSLDLRLRTLVTDRWKLTWYAEKDYGEIYDLENDPNEFVNLWDHCDPAIKYDLVSRLLDLVVANQDILPPKISHA